MTERPSIETVNHAEGPAPRGHYSQAVRAGGFIFVATQLPLPAGDEPRPEGAAAEAAQAIANVEAILRACSATLEDLVRVSFYLTDIADFDEVNRVYAERLGDHKPARGVIGVAELHLGFHVAVEAVALDPRQG